MKAFVSGILFVSGVIALSALCFVVKLVVFFNHYAHSQAVLFTGCE